MKLYLNAPCVSLWGGQGKLLLYELLRTAVLEGVKVIFYFYQRLINLLKFVLQMLEVFKTWPTPKNPPLMKQTYSPISWDSAHAVSLECAT